MNVLIVLAHPERRSFCGALQTTAVEVFHEQGHQVTTSDLYAMGWKAVLDRDDFADYPTDQPFNVQQAQRVAVATASQSPDIAEEQAKLASADLLILIFPVLTACSRSMLSMAEGAGSITVFIGASGR
jgi:NAD(P)H dehydrogenase (quinone)